MMLPRAARLWAMLVAYSALLAAVYFGQSARSFVRRSHAAEPSLGGRAGGGEL